MKNSAVRTTDPETSHAAAASLHLPAIEQAIVKCIEEQGPSTTHEITNATGIPLVTISPRLRPLTRKGLTQDSGVRRAGESKRVSIVWELTPKVAQ